jgi:hypothetical protein
MASRKVKLPFAQNNSRRMVMATLRIKDVSFVEVDAFVALTERLGATLIDLDGDGFNDQITALLDIPEDKLRGVTAAAKVRGMLG